MNGIRDCFTSFSYDILINNTFVSKDVIFLIDDTAKIHSVINGYKYGR